MSVPPPGAKAPLLDRMQTIDRRILWLILIVVIAIPTLWPTDIPNDPLPMSEGLWKAVDETPRDKIILISSDWSRGTRGESQGQMAALLHHIMERRIRFAVSSFGTDYAQVARNLIEDIAPDYDYQYGRDWVAFGFQANIATYIKGINVSILSTVKQDSINKRPLNTYPVMQGIFNADNIHMVVEISASALHNAWIQFLKRPTKIGFCPTSVMAPESIPYFTSGQLSGVLWGAKGAYDYEQLNDRNQIGRYSFGRRYMSPLSAAFGLVILSIVVGNTAMFLSRRQKAAQQGGQGQ